MSEENAPFAVVLLAAGESTRFGSPKLLASLDGETLLERAVRAAGQSGAVQVAVVVGAYAERMQPLLRLPTVTTVLNSDWREGMASSIRAGIAALLPHIQVAVIALADQPRVSAAHLRSLATAVNPNSPICASLYQGARGAPCAFYRSEFSSLLGLRGDRGAAALLRDRQDVLEISLPEAAFDVDLPGDLQSLPD